MSIEKNREADGKAEAEAPAARQDETLSPT